MEKHGKGKTRDEESGRKVGGDAERGGIGGAWEREEGSRKKEAGEKLRRCGKSGGKGGRSGKREAERETGPRVSGWKEGSEAGAKREPQWKREKNTAERRIGAGLGSSLSLGKNR